MPLSRIFLGSFFFVCVAVVGCQSPVQPGANDVRATKPARKLPQAADSIRQGTRGPQSAGSGVPFDFYLLNLSWSPEFCVTHPARQQCREKRAFIVHGLWPQNNDGTYPQHCGGRQGPSKPAEWADVMPDKGLVKHEWETHGTCTTYSGDAYFALLRKAFEKVKVPVSILPQGQETMMTPAAILAEFAKENPTFPEGSLALSCGNNRLTAIEVCMSKDLQPIACEGIRTCRANVVKITPQ
jgi:ribonuclease T2